MRRFTVLLLIGAVLTSCGDNTLDQSTAPGSTEGGVVTTEATATLPPATTSTSAAPPTSAATTTLPYSGFTVPDSGLCVIDHLYGDALNVRSGPGTSFGVVGTLAFDASGVTPTGVGAKDDQDRTWIEVDIGGGTGWAAGWLLTPCEVTLPGSYCVVDTTCDDRLNVRVGPGGSYEKMASLPFNATDVEATGATALDDEGRLWRQIRHYNDVGWVAGWFLTEAPCSASAGLPCNLPSGPPTPDCLNGWITPAAGSALWVDGLSYIGVGPGGNVDSSSFVVEEMRYFEGPEDANIIAPRRDVERWYIEGYSEIDPTYQSRWLAGRVDVGAGLRWTAVYGTTGFGPGIWEDCPDGCRTGFVGGNFCSAGCADDPQRQPCYPYAPGAWSPGDCTGLPPEVLGCVAGL
ncbi:MAG: SH3 domain-containing protein [Acidimicrobiia bacterium]|nr:SH3 domain-containing protein [Acidimicrobiia bacterium]